MSKIVIEECVVHGEKATDFRMWPVESYGECGGIVLYRGSFVCDKVMPFGHTLLCVTGGKSISRDVCVYEKKDSRWQFWALVPRRGKHEVLREMLYKRVYDSHLEAKVDNINANKAAREAVDNFDQLADVPEPE